MGILKCHCRHEGQDKLHGSKMRVHTPAGKAPRLLWRCTVCKHEKPRGRGDTDLTKSEKKQLLKAASQQVNKKDK